MQTNFFYRYCSLITYYSPLSQKINHRNVLTFHVLFFRPLVQVTREAKFTGFVLCVSFSLFDCSFLPRWRFPLEGISNPVENASFASEPARRVHCPLQESAACIDLRWVDPKVTTRIKQTRYFLALIFTSNCYNVYPNSWKLDRSS